MIERYIITFEDTAGKMFFNFKSAENALNFMLSAVTHVESNSIKVSLSYFKQEDN